VEVFIYLFILSCMMRLNLFISFMRGNWFPFIVISCQGLTAKNPATSDPVYHNWLVNMSVNWILKNGKKSPAFQIIYWALKRIQKKTIKSIICSTQGSARSNSWSNSKSKAHGCIYPSSSNWSRNITRKIRYPLVVGGILKHQGQNMVLKLSSEAMDGAKENGEAKR